MATPSISVRKIQLRAAAAISVGLIDKAIADYDAALQLDAKRATAHDAARKAEEGGEAGGDIPPAVKSNFRPRV
jgi:hypothetical protein